jgi:hypothetical protein
MGDALPAVVEAALAAVRVAAVHRPGRSCAAAIAVNDLRGLFLHDARLLPHFASPAVAATLVGAMHLHRECASVQQGCCQTLACAALEVPAIRVAKDAGVVEALTRALREHAEDGEFLIEAATLVINLTATHTGPRANEDDVANADAIVAQGGIEALVAGMRANAGSADVQERAAWALNLLCAPGGRRASDDASERACKVGALTALMTALRTHRAHAGVEIRCLYACSALCETQEPCRTQALAAGAIKLLSASVCRACAAPQPTPLLDIACRALTAVAADYDDALEAGQCGVIEPLVGVMRKHPHSHDTQRPCAIALHLLVMEMEVNMLRALNAGVLPCLEGVARDETDPMSALKDMVDEYVVVYHAEKQSAAAAADAAMAALLAEEEAERAHKSTPKRAGKKKRAGGAGGAQAASAPAQAEAAADAVPGAAAAPEAEETEEEEAQSAGAPARSAAAERRRRRAAAKSTQRATARAAPHGGGDAAVAAAVDEAEACESDTNGKADGSESDPDDDSGAGGGASGSSVHAASPLPAMPPASGSGSAPAHEAAGGSAGAAAAQGDAPASADLLEAIFPWMRMDEPRPPPPQVTHGGSGNSSGSGSGSGAASALLPPPPRAAASATPPAFSMGAAPAAAAAAKPESERPMCVICLDAPPCVLLLPCRHMSVCGAPACAAMMGAPPLCPLCRVGVADTISVFTL